MEEDKEIIKFMEDIKLYFKPICNLIDFEGIENYLYSEIIGDVEDDDLTMDFIFTLIDFMLKSQKKTKEETINFYDSIKKYMMRRMEETQLSIWKLDKILNNWEETNEKQV